MEKKKLLYFLGGVGIILLALFLIDDFSQEGKIEKTQEEIDVKVEKEVYDRKAEKQINHQDFWNSIEELISEKAIDTVQISENMASDTAKFFNQEREQKGNNTFTPVKNITSEKPNTPKNQTRKSNTKSKKQKTTTKTYASKEEDTYNRRQQLLNEIRFGKSQTNKGRKKIEKATQTILAKVSADVIVYDKQKVRLTLLEKLRVNGITIPAYTYVFARASFELDRINLAIESISYKNTPYKTNIIIYDKLDGGLGVKMKGNVFAKEKKQTRSITKERIKTPMTNNLTGRIIDGVVEDLTQEEEQVRKRKINKGRELILKVYEI